MTTGFTIRPITDGTWHIEDGTREGAAHTWAIRRMVLSYKSLPGLWRA